MSRMITPTDKANTEEFLEELADLSRRYKVHIHGCGCCGSPMIYTNDKETITGDMLTWEDDKYILDYAEVREIGAENFYD